MDFKQNQRGVRPALAKHAESFSVVALLLVAIIWGSTLVVSKSTTGTINPYLLIAMRFSIAFVVLGLVFFKRLKKLNLSYILGGGIIGLCLFAAHSSQTLGVTTFEGLPGRSGFLSAAYCVIVPFLAWVMIRRVPDIYNLMAAVLCISGIALISFGGDSAEVVPNAEANIISMADALALLSGVFFAGHIVTIEKYSVNKDPILITIVQFFFASIFASVAVAIEDPTAIQTAQWDKAGTGIAYLAVICTALALLLQNVGQKYTTPNRAAILLGTESLFCVLFGVWFADERVTLMLGLGFVLIFAAIIISETKLSFLRPEKKQ